jgi:ElaB/YqjD/DUF883 family membrane-anchored ribosome-binding protein
MATTTPPFSTGTSGTSDDVMNRVVQGAHEAVDRVAEKAGPAVERIRSGVSGAAESLHTHAEEFGALQEQWMQSARSCVREHPLATVAVAVAVGVLLSRISR